MEQQTPTGPSLLFTDAAAGKVSELIAEEGNLTEGDTRVENQGVTLLIDPMSIQYLSGAEIDYKEDLEGARFVIRNPNAQTTCGCGSSFSV